VSQLSRLSELSGFGVLQRMLNNMIIGTRCKSDHPVLRCLVIGEPPNIGKDESEDCPSAYSIS